MVIIYASPGNPPPISYHLITVPITQNQTLLNLPFPLTILLPHYLRELFP